MGDDDRPKGRFHKFAIRVGTVASAAALLAENAAGAPEGDVLADLLNRNEVIASSPLELDGSTKPLPPPLVLQPSHGGARLILAGHRSHSSHKSHSSHSSHVSGSSHSSHFSSTMRAGSGSTSSSSGSSAGSSGSSSGSSSPPATPPPAASSAPAREITPPPAAKVQAAPVIDLHDPRLRYQLITINNDNYARKAYMKDLLLKESRFVKAGETIGDCKLTEIIIDKMSVRLKPPTGSEFILKQSTPAAKR